MGTYTPGAGADAAYSTERRRDNLALVFQEVLTAIVRLRTNRQVVTDAALFRAQMRQALQTADQEARKRAYTGEQSSCSPRPALSYRPLLALPDSPRGCLSDFA